MLVVTRNIFESLLIGDDIVFKMLSISGNQVRIGSEAPASLAIDRE